jgi:hypothetical protein
MDWMCLLVVMELEALCLEWNCSENEEEDLFKREPEIIREFSPQLPPLNYLYSFSISSSLSSSISFADSKPILVIKNHDNLLILYEKEIPRDCPIDISSKVEKWIYLEIKSSDTRDQINHWSYLNERLKLIKISFQLLYFHSKLLLLVQENDLNLVEFFLTRGGHSPEVSFVLPRFLIQSSIESRNYTILNSLIRFYSQSFPSSLVIHCLGAEPNECEDLSTIPLMYSPLLRVLEAFGVKDCSLHFIGPNLRGREYDSLQILATEESSLQVKLVRYCGLYHDYTTPPELIDLLICFNAGFWGYSDWIPTLKLLPSLQINQIVVTSYTFQECEEDYDAVEEHCTQISSLQNDSQIQWNFESELNPFQVLQPMKRLSVPATASSEYFENQYWQSFTFVGMRNDSER